MKALGTEAIAKVRVFGKKQGEEPPPWNQEIELLKPSEPVPGQGAIADVHAIHTPPVFVGTITVEY
ncbi:MULTISPECIES: hypothetical protein [Trichocoleus]|uniref:Uncharacterized protein n=1 Tax=Trichocoleus desertorum GB2-A4 TaxID=2933944 RepID=A0ABV0JHI8_9CYAN|nr:hypothetical protein [Trichocoleus sp. FACHB-46]MBD1864532.1 hypothetical protein [Trichocoleus sp. FACHB-46]